MKRGGCLFLFVLAASGCQGSALLTRHFAADRAEEGARRWQTVRADVKLRLAEDHLSSGDAKAARKEALAAMELTPDSPRAYTILAKIELLDGRVGAAREFLTAAAAFPEPDAEVAYVTGILAQREGDPAAAEHFRRAAALERGNSEYLLAAVQAQAHNGAQAEALAEAEARLTDFDRDVPLRVFVGETRLLLGRFDEAAEALREAIDLGGESPGLSLELGLALLRARRHDEAIAVLEPLAARATEVPEPAVDRPGRDSNKRTPATIDPAVLCAPRLLATAYLESGAPDKARDVLLPWLIKRPTDSAALALLARAALEGGDWQAATQIGRRLIELNPADPQGPLLLSFGEMQAGRAEAALAAAKLALSLDESDGMARTLMERAEALIGQAAPIAMPKPPSDSALPDAPAGSPVPAMTPAAPAVRSDLPLCPSSPLSANRASTGAPNP